MKITSIFVSEKGYCKLLLCSASYRNTYGSSCRFTVYPRPRAGRRDQPAFKVKSILKGTEYECTFKFSRPFPIFVQVPLVSRQELVPWLQNQIAEQKRIDIATSGVPVVSHSIHSIHNIQHPPAGGKDTLDLQLLLPTDAKKQRKQVKQLFLDRGEFHNWMIFCPLLTTVIQLSKLVFRLNRLSNPACQRLRSMCLQ